jgi:hypothetical protein
MSTRRRLLQTAGALAVLPVLPAQEHQHDSAPAREATPKHSWQFLKVEERRAVAALVDAIIPRTDTPGASDAGVVEYIDEYLGARKERQSAFRRDLEGLQARTLRQHGKRFEELDAPGQRAVLEPLSAAGDRFFGLLKDLTIDAYYTSREGLAGELGWHGYTPLAEFKGCTHPEHQVQGERAEE